jgi:hypothetical protein
MIPTTPTEVVDLLFPARHYVNVAQVGHGGGACGVYGSAEETPLTSNARGVTCADCIGKMYQLGLSAIALDPDHPWL